MFGGFRVFAILVCSYGVSLIEGGNLGYQYPSPAAPVPPPSQPPVNYYAPVDYQPVINPNPEPTYSYYPSGPPAWDNVQWQPVESLPAWSYDDSSERVKPYYPSYQYAGPTTPCPKKVPSTTTTQRTTIPVIPITTTTLPPKVHALHSLKLTKGLSAVLPATPVPTTLAPTTLAPTTPVPVTPRPAAHNHLRYHDHHKHHHNPDHYHHKHHYHHHHGSAGSATVVQSTEVETLAPRINAVIRDLEEKVRELKLSFFKYGRLEDVNGRVDTVSPFAEKNEDPQEKEGETATDEGVKDSGRIEDLAEPEPETKATEELDPDNEESDMHPVDQNEGRLEANVHLQPEHRKVGELQGVVPWFNGVDIDLPRDLPLEDDYGYGNRATYGKNISPL